MVYDKNYDKERTPRRGRSNLTNLAFLASRNLHGIHNFKEFCLSDILGCKK
jgi:hypothetical protein